MESHQNHQKIFNELVSEMGYSWRQISQWSGISEWRLGRFHTGKHDLRAGEFLDLILAMPPEFQKHFKIEFKWIEHPLPIEALEQRISSLNPNEIPRVLEAIAFRVAETSSTTFRSKSLV